MGKPIRPIKAASLSFIDVQTAIDRAKDGDTIQLPAGEAGWAQKLIIPNKDIAILGAGAEQTVIRDDMPKGKLLEFNCAAGGTNHRLSGIKFKNGGLRPTKDTEGIIEINSTNINDTLFRADHNYFDNLNGHMVRTNNVIGVIDHNTFLTTPGRMALYVYNPNWNFAIDRWGDSSWFRPVQWGSKDFLFVEDNYFTRDSAIDGFRGTRLVARYNLFNSCHVTVHGTESGGRNRGSRAVEIYNNTYTNSYTEDVMSNIRSGSALIWGNTATGFKGVPKASRLTQFRCVHKFNPFGGADGLNPWDQNDIESNPTLYTASLGSRLKVETLNVNWEVNRWKGYTIKKISDYEESNMFAVILSNTSNTITFSDAATFGGSGVNFAAGEQFIITKVLNVLDGVGRGGGSLIPNNVWNVPPTKPANWNDQEYLPLYQWDNTHDGIPIGFGVHPSGAGTIFENEHFYNSEYIYTPYQYPHPLVK